VRTERLILRRWREEDREPFAALNADPLVMEFFPEPLSRAASDELVDRIEADFVRLGFGLWAVEIAGVAEFVGFVGLSEPTFTAHFTPAVEVGWRLARAFWGYGYASEAAAASVAFGFGSARLDEIVSFCVPENRRSRRVMERLGMTNDAADDFDHPRVPIGHRCRRHVLYRLERAEWAEREGVTRQGA
jgi:ribosomal-protein-alanine N-acetyltransferase